MEQGDKNRILEYESKLKYSRGLMRTPQKWTEHFWNQYYKKVTPYFKDRIGSAERVVFIGIGSGDIVPSLNEDERKKIIGLDVHFGNLLEAKKHSAVMAADGSQIPLKSGSIDLVICNQVLHHIIGQGNIEATIRECHRILKDGGQFIAAEPNSLHPSGALMNLANRFHMYNLLSGGSDYEFSISPVYIRKMLGESSFKNINISALIFSHPRLPVFIQDFLGGFEKRFSGFYVAGLINLYTAVK